MLGIFYKDLPSIKNKKKRIFTFKQNINLLILRRLNPKTKILNILV